VSATFRVSGFAEIEKALDELAKPATRKASARRSLIKAAAPLVSAAKAMAPRDQGDLVASIGVGTKLTKRQASLRRRMFRDEKAAVEVFFGAGGLAQATQQEFGNFKDTPKPYIRPAWDQGQAGMLERLKAELWIDIEKAVARQAKRAARR
jgi:hypothetical protein